MSRGRQAFGHTGETEAERRLRRQGYRILARNYRTRLGELDLVAESGESLVFVEVKSRRTGDFGGARHAVDARKQARMIRLAAQYLARHDIHDRPCRFDVIVCEGDLDHPLAIDHVQNAFEVPGDDLRW